MSWSALPPPARRLLLATCVAAVVAVVAAGVWGAAPTPLGVGLLALGIALGEALRIDMAYRAGGNASFGLSDAALTAGLLLLSGTDVVIGAAVGVIAIQLAERVQPVKFLLNTAQYVAGAAAAALIVDTLASPAGPLEPATVLVTAVGVAVFMLVNTGTVAGMIAFSSGRRWSRTWLRLLPTSSILAFGNVALGLLGVVLFADRPWVLPALGVPVVLLWSASRQEVRAQIQRERTAAFVEIEHLLGAAATPQAVAAVLADAVTRVLGGSGAVWLEDRWVTPVPPGSGPCTVDPATASAVLSPCTAVGPAEAGDCLAIGVGGGVLVAWAGELGLEADSSAWLERLGRSGRVHLARAAGAVALDQERATLRAVVDGTGDGVLLLDPDGTVRLWNPAMAGLSGIAADTAVGHGVVDLLGPGPWTDDGVHDVVHPATDAVWRISVAGIEDAAIAAGGRMRVVAVHDVTAERRAARMRDDMLAVVSHELRTPLTPIKASAQLLRLRADRLSEEQRQRLLAQIEERSEHLGRLVEDLLLVGQLSSSTPVAPQLARDAVDVGEVVAESAGALALSRPEHRLTVTVQDGLSARTDAARLRQILDNLVDNACKFSPAGSEVEVRLSADEAAGEVVLRVSDHGRGIPPAELERVFERFVRVEDPLVMTTSGAGLGLYIVRELTRALGGRVRLTSQLGVGTTAEVRLPLLSTQPSGVG